MITSVAVAVPVFVTTIGWGCGRPVIVGPVAGGTFALSAGMAGWRDTMQFGPDAVERAVAMVPSGLLTVHVTDRLSGILSTVNTASWRPAVNITGCGPSKAEGPMRLFFPRANPIGADPVASYPKDAVYVRPVLRTHWTNTPTCRSDFEVDA